MSASNEENSNSNIRYINAIDGQCGDRRTSLIPRELKIGCLCCRDLKIKMRAAEIPRPALALRPRCLNSVVPLRGGFFQFYR